MKRKIVKHGSATLTISLPSKWAKRHNIKPGDELDIVEDAGTLLIKASGVPESVKNTVLNINSHQTGPRYLRALFKAGCDNIIITYPDSSMFGCVVAPALDEFVGFEIMQQSEKKCVIKEISGLTDNTDLSTLINRTFILLLSLADDTHSALKEGNIELLGDLIKRDVTINRVTNFTRRLLNKKGCENPKDLPMIYHIVEELENLGDEYKYLCCYLLENKAKIKNPEILEIMSDANNLLREFYHLYFKFNHERAEKISKERAAINKRVITALSTRNIYELKTLDSVARMAQTVTHILGPYLTMRLPEICEEGLPGQQ